VHILTQKALRIRGRADEELQKTLEERCRRKKQMQAELHAQQAVVMAKAVDDGSATTELSRLRMEGTQFTCFTNTLSTNTDADACCRQAIW
jgi:hypothetical protein